MISFRDAVNKPIIGGHSGADIIRETGKQALTIAARNAAQNDGEKLLSPKNVVELMRNTGGALLNKSAHGINPQQNLTAAEIQEHSARLQEDSARISANLKTLSTQGMSLASRQMLVFMQAAEASNASLQTRLTEIEINTTRTKKLNAVMEVIQNHQSSNNSSIWPGTLLDVTDEKGETKSITFENLLKDLNIAQGLKLDSGHYKSGDWESIKSQAKAEIDAVGGQNNLANAKFQQDNNTYNNYCTMISTLISKTDKTAEGIIGNMR